MPVISDEKVTDETLEAWKNEAMISLKTTSRDYHDYSHHEAIYALVTELQERRKTEAEPIGYMNRFTGRVFSLDEQPGADTDTAVYLPVYTAPPAPVVPDGLRQALSNAGIAAPESDEMLAATCEKYIQMLVTWVKDRKPFQPVPVVPEEITDESTEQRLMGRRWAHSFCAGWNACRAAMLKGDAK
ncbi:hypothetical protein GXR56_002846 [Salmonella enterica]|nr:hypothetical protein [Salmonella enterica]